MLPVRVKSAVGEMPSSWRPAPVARERSCSGVQATERAAVAAVAEERRKRLRLRECMDNSCLEAGDGRRVVR
jgi:hypothetical protein